MKLFVLTLLVVASCSAAPYAPAVSSQYISQDNHGSYSYGYADPNSQKHESRSHDGVTHGAYSYVDGHGHVQSVKYTADPVHGFQVAGTNLPVGPAPAHPVAVSHAAIVAPLAHAYSPISYAHHGAPAVSYAHVSTPVAYAAPWAYGHAAHGVPQDTPEVAAAKIEHAHAHAEALAQHHHLYKRSLWAPAHSWAHAAAPVQIHNGVPVDTPEVQHAKAAHFAAHAAANHGHYAPAAPAYHSAHYAVPVIHNGVPVDTPEVQHAKAAHFAAVAEAQSRAHAAPAHHYAPAHYAPAHHAGAYHIPVIHNGVPVETPEVQHAKAAHFAAVAEAQAHSGHGHDSWSDEHAWDNGHHDW